MTIDINALRDYMREYYGAAIFAGMPAAIIDVTKVELASNDELVKLAMKEHIDLSKFAI